MRLRALALALLAVLAPAALPQDDANVFMGRPYSVPDTQEVLFLAEEARRAADAGAFEKMALKLQNILDFHQRSVLLSGRVRDERFVGYRVWVHQFLDALPPKGREAYEKLALPRAQELLDRAIERRDAALLTEVLQRYYRSGVGPRALRAAATLSLTSGDYAEAAYDLRQLERDFASEFAPKDRARLLFALAGAGDVTGYRRLRDSTRVAIAGPITVGGVETSFEDFLAPLDKKIEKAAKVADSGQSRWAFYGKTAARDVPAPPIYEVGSDSWTVPTDYRFREEDFSDSMQRGAAFGSGFPYEHHPIHPVVDRGTVFYQNGSMVYAVNLYTGKLIWAFSGPYGATLGKTNLGTVLSPAVKDGLVFVNLEVQVERPPPGARKFGGRTVIYDIPQRRLFALDAATGALRWSHENGRIRNTPDERYLAETNVNAPPLVVGDTVYVSVSRLSQRYFNYVLAVDAKTGRVKWRTRVCTGQQELNLFGRPIKELASGAISERDGRLYHVTNLGVAACLDRRTGTIIWIKGYPQIPIPFSVRWYRTDERVPTWTNAPVVVTEDAVYFTPTDSRYLVALERDTGKLRFRFDGSDPRNGDEVYRYLLGVGPKYLYVAGPRLLALDRRTGKVAWRADRGNFEPRQRGGEKERAAGRGVVGEDAVYVMTQRGLYSFDLSSGKRTGFEELTIDPGRMHRGYRSEGGNLVVAGQVLLVAQRDRIAAFYMWEQIYEELRRQARTDPTNPHLALEMGEVYAQGDRLQDAVNAFRRALALAKGLSAEERERVEYGARKGLYRIHMLQGEAALGGESPVSAANHFREALASAVDDQGKVRALLALGDFYRQTGRMTKLRSVYETLESEHGSVVFDFPGAGLAPAGLYALMHLTDMAVASSRYREAVGYLGRIIANYPRREILGDVESHVYARERIAHLIEQHGRAVYAPYEKRAEELFAIAEKDQSEAGLDAVARLYPNSRTAHEAGAELGRLLLLKGDYRKASLVLRRLLSEFPDSPKTPLFLYLLAESLEKRGYLLSAKSALTRLARGYPNAALTIDGKRVRAEDYATAKLAEEQYAALAAGEVRVDLPLRELWSANEGDNSYVRVLEPAGVAPAAVEGMLLLGTNGVLRAVDARTERTLWQLEMNGIVTRPVYSEGNLVLVNSTTIQAVSPETGTPLWEIPNNASVRAVAANPGTVFILTADFRDPSRVTLRALGPRSGELVWRKELPDHQVYDLLLLTEEAVGVAARDPSGVTVFDAATGRLRFRVEMEPRTLYREPFLVDEDKLFVVHANQRLDLYDMSSGRKLWETRLPKDRYFRSAIPVSGGIFLTDMQEHLLLVNAEDGSLRWTVKPDQEALLQYQGEAADRNRVWVIRRREKTGFYEACAHDLRTGEVLWRSELLKSKSATPSPILTERYAIYHMNSYDFSQSAWTSKSVFLDKATGRVEQEIAPEEFLGFFTYAFLRDGIYTLNARGRVAAFGK